jgi:hypothetical protein
VEILFNGIIIIVIIIIIIVIIIIIISISIIIIITTATTTTIIIRNLRDISLFKSALEANIVLLEAHQLLMMHVATFKQLFLSLVICNSYSTLLFIKLKLKLRGFGPLANYADRATAASWRSSANFCSNIKLFHINLLI